MLQTRAMKIAIGASTFVCAALLSITWSGNGGTSVSIDSAQARVGRPLTPVSVAGVARRHTRRAVYGHGYGYGAGVVGAGAVAAGAIAAGAVAAATTPAYVGWGGNDWGNAYAAQGDAHYGQPYYPERAYTGVSPYYGYAGWADYKTRNGIGCEPGTMTKLSDGQMYVCQ